MHVFNSVSRQHHEVWASQFPFLHSLRDVIPPSEACLYGHINWSLAQAHSVGLSQSFPSKRGGKARPQTGFHFTVQKRPMSGSVPGTSGASLPKRPHLESESEAHLSGKKSAGVSVSTSSAETRRKGGMGSAFLMCQSPQLLQPPHHLHLQLFRLVCFSNFLINGETSNRSVFNMVQGYHLQLRSHPPLFCDFWHLNVKVAAAHHPIIQREVDELLARGAIEPSSGGAGFYSSIFVVPKCTGAPDPHLT